MSGLPPAPYLPAGGLDAAMLRRGLLIGAAWGLGVAGILLALRASVAGVPDLFALVHGAAWGAGIGAFLMVPLVALFSRD
jgi:hypothetical protein